MMNQTLDPESKKALIEYRISRAKDTLEEAQEMMNNRRLNAAVNRIYYACFYAVIAALASEDINTKSHSGAKQLFALRFIRTSKLPFDVASYYSEIFNARTTGDYDDFATFTEEMVSRMFKNASYIIDSISNIIE